MMAILEVAAANLLSPMVLFFGLGLFASLVRAGLEVPQAVAKTLALYLMLAIGFKGGAAMAEQGIDARLVATVVAGMVLSFAIPFIAYVCLKRTTRLPVVDAAAVAAHYGSISVVTFVVAVNQLTTMGVPFEGYMVAVAAAMEAPAIISGLMLAFGFFKGSKPERGGENGLFREVALNGSIVLLVGSFIIGWVSGPDGLETLEPFIVDPFKGILCLFLLDMGIIAGRGLRTGIGELRPPLLIFGIYMPLISAVLGGTAGWMLDLSHGGVVLLMTLCASASYIAVPAAMRLALPEARPTIYLTLSLGVTFPFNLVVGIPLYIAAAGKIVS